MHPYPSSLYVPLTLCLTSKHRILIPPAWLSRLADPSASDLKTAATPPPISSPEYVSGFQAALTSQETAKLKELNPNEDMKTVSEARLLANSSCTAPGPADIVKDRENSSKRPSSSDVPPERVAIHAKQGQAHPQKSLLEPFWHDLDDDEGQPQQVQPGHDRRASQVVPVQ
jgi:hypothetical protein